MQERGGWELKELQLFIAAGLLGYFLQSVGYFLGMCATAKNRIKLPLLLILSALCTVFIFLIREIGQFNFGVHTMIMLIVLNLLGIIVLKLDVMRSILGSLIVTALVIGGEVINYSFLMFFYTKPEIDVLMQNSLSKAWAAVPGNVLLFAIVLIAYILRIRKGRKVE
jgi:hypothetical protein